MEITQNQQAINLAALLFVRGGFSLESGLHDGEVSALHVLKQVKAVVAGLADRQPDARSGGVCNVPPTGGRDLPAVPETPAGAAPARSDHLLASSGDAGEMSCEQLSKDAAQTTLMLVEVQRWYREQSVIEP